MSFPRYDRTASGALHFRLRETDSGHLGVPAGETLGIAFNAESGALFKHGSLQFVREYFDACTRRLRDAGFHDDARGWALREVPLDQLTDELLAEINHALACTGYMAVLAAKLANRP